MRFIFFPSFEDRRECGNVYITIILDCFFFFNRLIYFLVFDFNMVFFRVQFFFHKHLRWWWWSGIRGGRVVNFKFQFIELIRLLIRRYISQSPWFKLLTKSKIK